MQPWSGQETFERQCNPYYSHHDLSLSVCLVDYSDGDQSMDTVSLQAVTLADGSTAYIPHNPQGMPITMPSE